MGHESSAAPVRMVVTGSVVDRALGAAFHALAREPRLLAQTLTAAAESATA
jgi:hypothetical protein